MKRPQTVTAEVLRERLVQRWKRYLYEKEGSPLLTVEGWLQIVNDPPAIHDRDNDLGIRDYRFIDRNQVQAIFKTVTDIVSNVVSQIAAGMDSFDHHPLLLFNEVMAITDLKRLRQCVICPRYFYAERGNKKVCSERCGTLLRVRRHRGKQSTYELNRKLKGATQKKDAQNRKAPEKRR